MNINPNTQVHMYSQVALSAFIHTHTHTHTHTQNLLSKCNLVSKVKGQTINLQGTYWATPSGLHKMQKHISTL